MAGAINVSSFSGTMLDNGRNTPTETLLTTDLDGSQTAVKVSEGRLLIARRGKVVLRQERQQSVFTEIRGDESQFYIPVIQSKLLVAMGSGKGREEFSKQGSTVQQISKPAGSLVCRLRYKLGPCATAVISIPETGASH